MPLIPKNDAYFEDFDTAIALVRKMSQTLHEAVNQPKLPEGLWNRVKELETQADAIVRRCLTRLDETFVTPIEREDIHMLIVNIDDVADMIEAATSRVDIYEITEPTPELRTMVAALDEMVEQLVTAVQSLRTLKPVAVREATVKVDRLEEKIDTLYRDTLRVLFRRHPEAFDLVRWKDVYDLIEEASDRGRHVARTLNHILVRHS